MHRVRFCFFLLICLSFASVQLNIILASLKGDNLLFIEENEVFALSGGELFSQVPLAEE